MKKRVPRTNSVWHQWHAYFGPPFNTCCLKCSTAFRRKKQKKLSTVYQNKSEKGVRDGMILYAFRPSAVDIRFSARHFHARIVKMTMALVRYTTVYLG